MAKSQAKKLREKLAREGKMNPEERRSPFVFADMRTRTTKTKKGHLCRPKHKNHQFQDGNDGSFYFVHNVSCLIKLRLSRYNPCASSSETGENRMTELGAA